MQRRTFSVSWSQVIRGIVLSDFVLLGLDSSRLGLYQNFHIENGVFYAAYWMVLSTALLLILVGLEVGERLQIRRAAGPGNPPTILYSGLLIDASLVTAWLVVLFVSSARAGAGVV